jgi:broad specificity phosphatase PhoE
MVQQSHEKKTCETKNAGQNGGLVYLIRHGETEWARDGRHTGRTDIPLTETGRAQAGFLLPIFDEASFSHILSSPLRRALETARLAGQGNRVELVPDLMEWDYGDYEGITTTQIRKKIPDWSIWTHPCPNGETINDVSARADKVVSQVRVQESNVALFSHGHFLRVLAARWLGFEPACGKYFLLGTSTLSILDYEGATPVIKTWNGPLITAACAVPWRQESS